MSKEELLEKIEYLTSMPHSSLVEHCIYLENENDNYKAQKYITDFITENGIICKKNKEVNELQLKNEQFKAKIKRRDEFIKYQQQKIDKAIEYIKTSMNNPQPFYKYLYGDDDGQVQNLEKLLKILGGEENE